MATRKTVEIYLVTLTTTLIRTFLVITPIIDMTLLLLVLEQVLVQEEDVLIAATAVILVAHRLQASKVNHT